MCVMEASDGRALGVVVGGRIDISVALRGDLEGKRE